MANDHSMPPAEGSRWRFAAGSRLIVCGGALVIVLAVCWWQQRTCASLRDTADIMETRLNQMQADAARIETLRSAPKVALSRARANEDLLRQVEDALSQAGVDRDHWRSSTPLPVHRIAGSDYRRHGTRISLERLTFRQLATFVWHLEADPTLAVAMIGITSNTLRDEAYNSDLVIGYLEFAPRRPDNGLD